ncbi:MAG TPA: phosphopantetheine-binding protein, partial [Kouleothrix sp.]|nr:phosphopantetheine-binding protein [Kouleothrix sp.]
VPRGGQAGGEIERDALIGTLRAFLGARLPEYMLPSAFVLLGALPLTANGKTNRRALPAPEPRQINGASGFVAPRSQLEQQIAAIWRQVLQVEQIGIHDSFFDLGGHSLLMAQAHSLLREALGRDLPLIKLLEHPTVGALAQYLSQDQPAQQSFEPSHDRAKKQREMLARQRQRVKYGA